MTYKSLKRLFLVDDSLVVILDDRSKVWNHVENLIKIRPCTQASLMPAYCF